MLLILIHRFHLPIWARIRPGNASRLLLPSSHHKPQKQGRLTWTISAVLFALCFGSLAAAIMGTIRLAMTRQRNAYGIYSPQTWSGNYLVLESTFNNSFYSAAGTKLGSLVTADPVHGAAATIEIHNSRGNILQTINYSSFFPVQFNVTCLSTINNPIVNDCASGELVNQPTVSYDGYSELDPQDHQKPEFVGFLNLTVLSSNPLTFLNVTSSPNVWTSGQAYQGIGCVYAPLGEWYLDNSTLLQIGWRSSGTMSRVAN